MCIQTNVLLIEVRNDKCNDDISFDVGTPSNSTHIQANRPALKDTMGGEVIN